MMQNILREKIDALLGKISDYRKHRKKAIKGHEHNLISRVESEIIDKMINLNFYVESRSSGEWLVFRKNTQSVRVWLPKEEDKLPSGHYPVSIVYNGILYRILVYVNHKYANHEHNYLTMDYVVYLNKKLQAIKKELHELAQTGCSDIDGSYVVYCSFPETASGTYPSLDGFINKIIKEKHEH